MQNHTPILCIVYRITNLIDGKVYVGQSRMSLAKRMTSHRFDSRRVRSALYHAIRKHGWENFKAEVIESNICLPSIDEREKFWISELNSLVPNGYNLELGGRSQKSVSDETRRKMALAKAGKKRDPMSEETKRRIGIANKGRVPAPHVIRAAVAAMADRPNPFLGKHHTDQTKAILSIKNTGRKTHTDERRAQMSRLRRGASNPFYGKHHTPQTRAKISASVRALRAEQTKKGIECRPQSCQQT